MMYSKNLGPRLYAFLLLLLTNVLITSIAFAEPLTFTYTGRFNIVQGETSLSSVFAVGDTFTLTYTFDSNAPNLIPGGGGRYAITSLTFTVDTSTDFETLPWEGEGGFINIFDQPFTTVDTYSILVAPPSPGFGSLTGPTPNGWTVQQLNFFLQDSSNQAITTGAALILEQPDPADFPSRNDLNLGLNNPSLGLPGRVAAGPLELPVVSIKPTADAGSNQLIHVGETVILDGTGSFDDTTASEDLLYDWSFNATPAGSSAVLVGEDTATPSFVADVPGTFAVQLVVEDEAGNVSGPDTVEILSEIVTEAVIDDLQDIVDNDPGAPLADKLEDAIVKLQTALDEFNNTPPDNQSAVGDLEGAVGDIEAAINEGLDLMQGIELMDQLAGIARQVATDALDQAIARGADPTVVADAQQALDDGDFLRASGAFFKDAVNKYKDALAKAESG